MRMKDACWWETKNSNRRRIKKSGQWRVISDQQFADKTKNQGVGAGTGMTILFGGGGGRIR
jgi:hypothetical protein